MSKYPKDVAKRFVKPVAGRAISALNPLDLLTQYVKLKQSEDVERTKRVEIIAQRDVAITEILAKRDIILQVCGQIFSERQQALGELYMLLEEARKEGDESKLDVALHGIVGIVATSPFMAFQEFKDAMKDKSGPISL